MANGTSTLCWLQGPIGSSTLEDRQTRSLWVFFFAFKGLLCGLINEVGMYRYKVTC